MARPKKRPDLVHCKVRPQIHPTAPWRVSYPVEKDGKTVLVRKAFSDEDRAWQFAEEKDIEIANHGVRFGDLPPEARRAFDSYRDLRVELENLGAIVPPFEDLVRDALTRIRATHAALSSVTFAEGLETFLAYKQARVGTRQQQDLKDRLGRFSQDYGTSPVASITTGLVEGWLHSLRSRRNPGGAETPPLVSALTRNHHRAALGAFFNFAAHPSRGWTERNPVAALEKERVTTTEPRAYTVEDAAKLLHTAQEKHPELLPMLALGFFAGLRVSEAMGVDLAKVCGADVEEFRVTGKTGPRLVPMTDACRHWLTEQPRHRGKAWQQSARSLVDAVRTLFADAEVEQIDNGLRHSFISYRTAELRDVARVADECGNSAQVVKNHYRQLVTAAEAEKFFVIKSK